MIARSTKCISLHFAHKRRLLRIDETKLMWRKLAVSGLSFDPNIYFDLCCLQDFRFRLHEIPIKAEALRWTAEKTLCTGYRCCLVPATCSPLQQLAYPYRWIDLDVVLGMHSPALIEVL